MGKGYMKIFMWVIITGVITLLAAVIIILLLGHLRQPKAELGGLFVKDTAWENSEL